MKLLSAEEVHSRKVAELGLDPHAIDLTATESLAAALRRVAGFLCPCAPATIVRAVVHPLRGLINDVEAVKDIAEATLDAMVAYGDFLEQGDISEDAQRHRGVLLYAAPPSFVARGSGAALLLGIAPDQPSALPQELYTRIEYVRHIRRLPTDGIEDLRSDLIQLGILELPAEVWLKSPPAETFAQHLLRMNTLLDGASPSGDIPGLMLLDSTRPVRFYRGRWVEPRSQTGRFVCRRNQAYGADLWCYAHVRNGRAERFIDLPLMGGRSRGCDEAWRLQMAIDAHRDEFQRFKLRDGPGDTRILELFSPVPMWAQRRWDSVGEPVPRSGCLFAYRFRDKEVPEELRFLRETLWLAELTEGRRPTIRMQECP
jgi:hypothetical protein